MAGFRHTLRKIIICISAMLFLLAFTLNLQAATTAIGLAGFSGTETVVDFNSIADEELITTQFVGSGVTFSGAIYGMTNSADLANFPNPGGVIASNWLYSQSANQGLSFTVTFSSIQRKVGFHVSTNDPDDTTMEVFLGGPSQGSVLFDTNNLGNLFIGVAEPNGFDSLTVTVQNNDNGFIAIDDLRFELLCTSDIQCNDGLFCNGTETCDIPSGNCVAVSACPPFIDGCVTRGGFCNEVSDMCEDVADDGQCFAGETCDINSGNCIPAVKDVPTMGQWGMVIFLFLAGLAAIVYLRKRRI